ncbi:heavy metal-associated isoprenylated plant protein 8-like isoform X1 [Populus alba]|uniref:heavy metal-associated isoprenylated plant protein 8-like isoform X1 n=1 Tax=Populus alba TaxID=43335 RepID=UPI003CC73849
MGAEQKEGAKAEAEKKPAADAGEKKDEAKVISVYKLGMYCEGCAKEIRHAVKHLEGVEGLKTDCAGNKLTVTGKVDPAKIKATLEEKTKRKVEILSPQPKKDDGAAAGGGDKKADEKPEGKKEEAKKTTSREYRRFENQATL